MLRNSCSMTEKTDRSKEDTLLSFETELLEFTLKIY